MSIKNRAESDRTAVRNRKHNQIQTDGKDKEQKKGIDEQLVKVQE